jgi:hypothetical protein
MKIAIEVTGPEERALAEAANRLNIPATELAAAAVRDLVSQPEQEFAQLAERIVKKNEALYRRLA